MNATPLIGLCRTLVQTGLTLFCRSGLVLLLGLLLAAVLRRRGPLVQSLVYRAALSAVLLTALFSLSPAPAVRPLWRVSLPATPADASETLVTPLPTWNKPPATVLPMSHVPTPPLPDTSAHDAVEAETAPPSTIPRSSQAYMTIAALWGAGTAGLLVWLLIGYAYLRRVRRRGRPVTTGLAANLLRELCAKRAQGPIPLIASPHLRSPFLAGVWRPTIFLPSSFSADFTAPTLRAIFTHELVHRERGDNAWTLLARLTAACLWTQPLLWLLIRRMEHASEEVCDALALSAGCSPRVYADCLLSLAERRAPSRLERSWGAGIVPFRSQLGRRIHAVLTRGQGIAPRVPTATKTLVFVSLLCAGAGGVLLLSAGGAPPLPDAPVPGTTQTLAQLLQTRALRQSRAAVAEVADQADERTLRAELQRALPNAAPSDITSVEALESHIAARRFMLEHPSGYDGPPDHRPTASLAEQSRIAARRRAELAVLLSQEKALFAQGRLTPAHLALIHALAAQQSASRWKSLTNNTSVESLDRLIERRAMATPAARLSPAVRKACLAVLQQDRDQQTMMLPQMQKALTLADQNVQFHLTTPIPPLLKMSLHAGVRRFSEQQKAAYIHAVHEHNSHLVAHWDAVARKRTFAEAVRFSEKHLAQLDDEIKKLR